jgi:hypothetical protein
MSQNDAGCHISRDTSGEPSHPTLDISNKDDGREELQQRQGPGEEEVQREHDGNGCGDNDSHDGDNDKDCDDSEGPRPAKRRRPSPSNSTCKRRLQRPHYSRSRSPSNVDGGQTTLVQTQFKRLSPLRCNYRHQSQRNPTRSSVGEEEPTSNIGAEYREWPCMGSLNAHRLEMRYATVWSLA